MNELQIFNYSNKQVRTILKDGEPWFVAKDVADILGYECPEKMYARIDQEDRQTIETSPVRQNGMGYLPPVRMVFINEGGVYESVFGSILPEAKQFKRWITHEVIPSIRKHGAYMTPDTIDRMIASPEFGIKLLTALKEEQEKNAKLLPKAEGYDNLMNAEGTVTMKEAASLIDIKNVGQNKFFKLLCMEGIIQKVGNSYLPCSNYKDKFTVKQNPVWNGFSYDNRSQLYLDMQGLDWLTRLLVKRGYQVNCTQQKALV